MQTVLSFLAALLSKVLVSFIAQAKSEADAKAEGVREAAATTQQVVKETADARSQISDSTSIDDLVNRMRDDASRG